MRNENFWAELWSVFNAFENSFFPVRDDQLHVAVRGKLKNYLQNKKVERKSPNSTSNLLKKIKF